MQADDTAVDNSTAAEGQDESVASELVDKPITLSEDLPAVIELLPEPLQPYWALVNQYPLLEGALIVLAFWAFAWLIRRYVLNVVVHIAGATEGDLDDRIVEELRGPIFTTIVLFGLMLAIAVTFSEVGWLKYATPTLVTLIIIIWIRVALTSVTMIVTAASRHESRFHKIDVATEPLLIIVGKLIILLIGSYLLLKVWGVNPVGWLASAGIIGIVVGFAAKDSIANLFSGVFIVADRPYKLGDYIILDSGERGKVTHIGIRSTRLLTRDDVEVTIPNGIMGNAKIVNESGGPYPKMRVRIEIQCAYDADLEEVCELLMNIAHQEELVCQYPSPRVRVRHFADSGIVVQLMGWIDRPEDRGRITHILNMKVHRAFREANLEIPFPKRDITITHSDIPAEK